VVKEEKALVLMLDGFDQALQSTCDRRSPHILCEHLFDLAQAFSKFYASCPVLAANGSAVQSSRLQLVETTLRQLQTGLGLLGIETPERM